MKTRSIHVYVRPSTMQILLCHSRHLVIVQDITIMCYHKWHVHNILQISLKLTNSKWRPWSHHNLSILCKFCLAIWITTNGQHNLCYPYREINNKVFDGTIYAMTLMSSLLYYIKMSTQPMTCHEHNANTIKFKVVQTMSLTLSVWVKSNKTKQNHEVIKYELHKAAFCSFNNVMHVYLRVLWLICNSDWDSCQWNLEDTINFYAPWSSLCARSNKF